MYHQCSASQSNFWASVTEYPDLGPNLQKHSHSWIPIHQVLSTSTVVTFPMMWLAHHLFSSIECTEYLLHYNNLEYLGPNPSWIPDLIQLRRSFVPLQWKISLRAKSINSNENQILHLNKFFLVRKKVHVHKHCFHLPAQSVISPICIWLSTAWPTHTTVTCSAWENPPFAHTAGNSFVH